MRKIIWVLSCVVIMSLTGIHVNAANSISYYYDGQWHDYNEPPVSLQINGDAVTAEVPPIVLNDRTLVPVRNVFEKIGATVSWDAYSQKVKILYDNIHIELTVDNDMATVNDAVYKMDIPAKIISPETMVSKTMIPLRFVAENLGLHVDWDENTRLISIFTPDKWKPAENTKNLPGIDVSNWQGDIDFSSVKNTGVQIVYIKSTEGVTYTDPFLQANYQGAKDNGLDVGFYHYLRNNDPIEEAKHFLSQVDGLTVDCKYIIDVEETFGQTPEQISASVRQFADYLISQGKDVGIYTYLNFYKNNLNDSVKDLPVWLAQYDVSRPAIPCVGWQNSSKGSISGINGNVDTNYFGDGIFSGKSGNLVDLTTIPEIGTKIVNVNSKLNIRSSPSTYGDVIGQLGNGDKVWYNARIINVNDETWYRLDCNGQSGFVSGDYLTDLPK